MKGFIVLMLVSFQCLAQTPATNPCDAKIYRAFDFWVGDWEVYGNEDKSGPLLGTNQISREQGGCLLTEKWTGASGSTGTSMNYYDGAKKQWVQHWVSPGGVSISYYGGITDGSMVLMGEIFYATQSENPVRDFRGTWTPLKSGAVKQFFEESIDGGKTWYPWFTGFYFPKND